MAFNDKKHEQPVFINMATGESAENLKAFEPQCGMFQIMIIFNNTNANMCLSYRTKDVATDHWNFILRNLDGHVRFSECDDFGNLVSINPDSVSYPLFSDLELAQFNKYEQDICMRRAEKKIIERLNNSPDERNLFPSENQSPQYKQSKIIQ